MTKKKQTKEIVMSAAVEEAESLGVLGLTRDAIARRAKVSDGTVSFHFNTMHQLKKAVVRRAVVDENIPVLLSVLTSARYGKPITGDLRAKVIAEL